MSSAIYLDLVEQWAALEERIHEKAREAEMFRVLGDAEQRAEALADFASLQKQQENLDLRLRALREDHA